MQILTNNKILTSFLISLFLHFALFFLFLEFKKEFKIINPPFSEADKITSIQFIKLTPPNEPTQTKNLEPEPIHQQNQIDKKIEKSKTEPIEEKIIQNKIVEKFEPTKKEDPKIVLPEKENINIEPEKIIKKVQNETPKQPEKQVEKYPIDKPVQKEKTVENSLLDALKTKPKEIQIDSTTRSYVKLYGEEFNNFDDNTKEYLIANLSKIADATKRYLRYPSISIRTMQQGIAAVEFMLYPNGDISDLKMLSSSTYSALDQNTIRTIQIAYKDYPKPSKPTKIKIFVNYILH